MSVSRAQSSWVGAGEVAAVVIRVAGASPDSVWWTTVWTSCFISQFELDSGGGREILVLDTFVSS